jgi:hypothetical protein
MGTYRTDYYFPQPVYYMVARSQEIVTQALRERLGTHFIPRDIQWQQLPSPTGHPCASLNLAERINGRTGAALVEGYSGIDNTFCVTVQTYNTQHGGASISFPFDTCTLQNTEYQTEVETHAGTTSRRNGRCQHGAIAEIVRFVTLVLR